MPDDDDDMALFKAAMQDVKPIQNDKVDTELPRPKPRARFRESDEQAVIEELLSHAIDAGELETGEHLSYISLGVQQQVLRKLRRGQYSIGRVLDLHGHNTDEAYVAVHNFLNDCGKDHMTSVRIIHGKGNRSAQGPVLKRKLGSWLRRRKDVLAYCSARPNDGGTGAVYVLLKRKS